MTNSTNDFYKKLFWILTLLCIIIGGLAVQLLYDKTKLRFETGELLTNFELKNNELKTKIINDSITNYSQKLIIIAERDAIKGGVYKQLSDLSQKLTKLQSQVTLTIESGIKGLEVPVNKRDTLKITDTDTVRMLGEFEYSDRWLHLKGYQALNNVYFDEIGFKDSISVTIGEFRYKGLKRVFKKPEYKLNIETTSPYSKVLNASNIFVKTPPKRWHIGLTAGVGWNPLHPLEPQPVITFGVTRSFISF